MLYCVFLKIFVLFKCKLYKIVPNLLSYWCFILSILSVFPVHSPSFRAHLASIRKKNFRNLSLLCFIRNHFVFFQIRIPDRKAFFLCRHPAIPPLKRLYGAQKRATRIAHFMANQKSEELYTKPSAQSKCSPLPGRWQPSAANPPDSPAELATASPDFLCMHSQSPQKPLGRCASLRLDNRAPFPLIHQLSFCRKALFRGNRACLWVSCPKIPHSSGSQ